MPQRIAAITALTVFVGCLVSGAFGAENSFVTAVERALVAMFATLVIGWLVGWMAQKMIDENVRQTTATANAPPAPAAATARAKSAQPVGKK